MWRVSPLSSACSSLCAYKASRLTKQAWPVFVMWYMLGRCVARSWRLNLWESPLCKKERENPTFKKKKLYLFILRERGREGEKLGLSASLTHPNR